LASATVDMHRNPVKHAEALRRGVVAVIRETGRFLVIRRSAAVEAPGTYCFPGGGIEDGESELDALRRELREELQTEITPLTRLWESTTPWRVRLVWWSAALPSGSQPVANPREVRSVHCLVEAEIRRLPGLLASNWDFLEAWRAGQFTLD
jgi:8-oxo-dGTP diphosphatase